MSLQKWLGVWLVSVRAGPEIIAWSNLGHWYWKLPSQRENAGQLQWRTVFFLSLASNWFCGFSQPASPSTSASSCVTWAQMHSILQRLRAQRGQHTAACQGPRCGTWEPGSFTICTEHGCLVPTGPVMMEWTKACNTSHSPLPTANTCTCYVCHFEKECWRFRCCFRCRTKTTILCC